MKAHIKGMAYGLFFSVMFLVGGALAGNITNVGMYQGDLFTFLSNVVTMDNETKGDYNSMFSDYTALINTFNNMTSGEVGATSFTKSSATAVTTTDLTLSGL